jgi:hypothetical protein
VEVAAEVIALSIKDQIVQVPNHGYQVIAWSDGDLPEIEALSADGTTLSRLQLRLPDFDPHTTT